MNIFEIANSRISTGQRIFCVVPHGNKYLICEVTKNKQGQNSILRIIEPDGTEFANVDLTDVGVHHVFSITGIRSHQDGHLKFFVEAWPINEDYSGDSVIVLVDTLIPIDPPTGV